MGFLSDGIKKFLANREASESIAPDQRVTDPKAGPGYIKLGPIDMSTAQTSGPDVSNDQRYPPPQHTLDDLREAAPPVQGGTASRAYAPRTPDAMLASASGPGPASKGGASSAFGILQDQAAASGSMRSDDPMGLATARVSGYNARQGTVDPATMMSAEQLNKITSQDSANMRRASQQGMLSAASRGLQNSSIAAGAAQGAMVDRATPLAQQDAATYYSNMRSNVDAQNRASEVSAQLKAQAAMQNAALAGQMGMQQSQLETQVSMANAQAENDLKALSSQLQTAVNQQNADAVNRIQQQMADIQSQMSMRNAELSTQMSQFNASSVNQMNAQVLQGNQTLNEQFLRGEQAVDLADIQGRYNQIIQANATAGNIYGQYMQSLGDMMANHEQTPGRVASYINVMSQQLEGSLGLIDAMNSLNLNPDVMDVPGATSGSSGTISPGYDPANNVASGFNTRMSRNAPRKIGGYA